MPMRRSLFLLLLVPTLAWGKVYYASPSGSGAACSKAVPCALVTGAAKPGAGDTLYLRGGTYSDGIKTATSAIRSGTSWDNPVIIASAPGETAVIRGSIDLNGYHTNLVPGVAYVQFKGLVLDGGGISILKDNIHHLRFQNMEVKNVRQAGPACSLGGPEVCPGRSAIYGGAGRTTSSLAACRCMTTGSTSWITAFT